MAWSDFTQPPHLCSGTRLENKMLDTKARSCLRFFALACVVGMYATHALAAPSATTPAVSMFQVNDLTSNAHGRKDNDVTISRARAIEDLDALEQAITDNSSYIWSSTFPYQRTIAGIKQALPDEVSVNGLAVQINKLVRLFGDDHAQVRGWTANIPQRSVPFELGYADARYFLYQLEPEGLLDAEHPYVRAMDGVLIDEWVRVAGDIGQGPYSAVAARFSRGKRLFPYIDYLRSEMGLPLNDSVAVELVSEDGSRSVTRSIALVDEPQRKGRSFNLPTASRMLDNNIGYLRVPAHTGEREAEFLTRIDDEMKRFRNTDALVLDARMSGGGARRVLNSLFPYFMPADAAPYIFNVVKLRIPASKPDFDPLAIFGGAKRFLYIDDPDLPADEAAAYKEFARTFTPTWMPPADKFTNWYFMSLRPHADKPYYDKPVYMLVDWGVGSAGDIFTSAFKGWGNITVLGTPTMGRSGQGVVFPLPNSKLGVNLSTMSSYQKTGERYDTVGITPDIVVEPALSDWYNATDTVLDRMHAMLAAKLVEQGQGK